MRLDETDEEIIKRLMELRDYLGRRASELEDEAEKLRSLFKIVDEVIMTRSFRKASAIPTPPPEPAAPPERGGEEIPLKTSTGLLLANLYVEGKEARIVPDEGLVFSVNTPPFQSFLLNRILDSMQAKDREAVQRGEIRPDEALSYDVLLEGDVIREIVVRNFGTSRRLREINSTSRWTLEKMYEKTRGQE